MTDECFSEHNPFEQISMYNGEVKLEFDVDQHVYYEVVGDERLVVLGVTNVTGSIDKSAALTQWAANETVHLILKTVPTSQEARDELLAYYQQVKDKQPLVVPSKYALAISTNEFAELLNNARFSFRTIKKEAADIGHIAHAWLEAKIKAWLAGDKQFDQPLPEDPRAAKCVEAALSWWNKHEFVPLHSEEKVYSRIHGLAGTLDWIGYVTSCGNPKCCPFEGVALELGDFKSSKSLYPEYWLQLRAYQLCVEEEFGDIGIQHKRLLKLGKEDGEFETQVRPQECDERDLDGLLGQLQIYSWIQQNDIDAKDIKLEIKAAKQAAKALQPRPARRPRLKKQVFDPIPVETAV